MLVVEKQYTKMIRGLGAWYIVTICWDTRKKYISQTEMEPALALLLMVRRLADQISHSKQWGV